MKTHNSPSGTTCQQLVNKHSLLVQELGEKLERGESPIEKSELTLEMESADTGPLAHRSPRHIHLQVCPEPQEMRLKQDVSFVSAPESAKRLVITQFPLQEARDG